MKKLHRIQVGDWKRTAVLTNPIEGKVGIVNTAATTYAVNLGYREMAVLRVL